MLAFDVLDRLDFQQHDALDDDVGHEFSDYLSPEPHEDRRVLDNLQAGFAQGDDHGAVIDLFEESAAQFPVNLIEDCEDTIGDGPMK